MTEDEIGFLAALEIAAELWLDTIRFDDLYARGDVEAAALASVLQRWLATRGKGPLYKVPRPSKRAPRATLTMRHPADVPVYCNTCSLAMWQRESDHFAIRGFCDERIIDCPFEDPCPYRAKLT